MLQTLQSAPEIVESITLLACPTDIDIMTESCGLDFGERVRAAEAVLAMFSLALMMEGDRMRDAVDGAELPTQFLLDVRVGEC